MFNGKDSVLEDSEKDNNTFNKNFFITDILPERLAEFKQKLTNQKSSNIQSS